MDLEQLSNKIEPYFPNMKESVFIRTSCCCRKYLETSSCCYKFGHIGSKHFYHRRSFYMSIALFIGFIQLILSCLSLFSLGSSEWSLKYFSWAEVYADGTILTEQQVFYVGLQAVYNKLPEIQVKKWDQIQKFFPQCQAACDGVITLVMLAAVTTLIRMRNMLRRGKNVNDRFCYKGTAVALGLFGIFSNSSALLTFSKGCVEMSDNLKHVEIYYGPSFWMIFTGVGIKIITVIFHILIPVPREFKAGTSKLKFEEFDKEHPSPQVDYQDSFLQDQESNAISIQETRREQDSDQASQKEISQENNQEKVEQPSNTEENKNHEQQSGQN